MLGEEPLLEMVSNTNRQPLLILYGKPASGYSIERRTNLVSGAWQPVLTNLTIGTNLFLTFSPPPGSGPENYYRASRAIPVLPPKIIGLAEVSGTNVLLSFTGVSGQPYRVQFTPTLSPPEWQTLATNIAGADGLFQFTDTNGWWQTQRFYRLVLTNRVPQPRERGASNLQTGASERPPWGSQTGRRSLAAGRGLPALQS